MAMRFRVLVFGTEAVYTRFTRMARDAADASPAFDDVAEELMRITDIQFQSQGRRGGGSWKRLTQKWLNFKVNKGLDPRILHMRGPLRASVTQRGAPGQILKISPTQLDFGSSLSYARTHQYGYPPRNIPKRQFIKLLDGDRTNIRNMIRDHIMEGTS
jgi:phage gpG-like protein